MPFNYSKYVTFFDNLFAVMTDDTFWSQKLFEICLLSLLALIRFESQKKKKASESNCLKFLKNFIGKVPNLKLNLIFFLKLKC